MREAAINSLIYTRNLTVCTAFVSAWFTVIPHLLGYSLQHGLAMSFLAPLSMGVLGLGLGCSVLYTGYKLFEVYTTPPTHITPMNNPPVTENPHKLLDAFFRGIEITYQASLVASAGCLTYLQLFPHTTLYAPLLTAALISSEFNLGIWALGLGVCILLLVRLLFRRYTSIANWSYLRLTLRKPLNI